MKDLIVGQTESGDRYSATEEKWAEYRQAWQDGDMEKVMRLEEGWDEDFTYTP